MVGARCQGQATSLQCMEFSAVSTAAKGSMRQRGTWIDPRTLEVIIHLVLSVVSVLDSA